MIRWIISASCVLISAFVGCSDPDRVQPQAPSSPCATKWRDVAPGIRYRTLNCTADRNLHLVRLDPKRTHIGAAMQPGGSAAGVVRDGGWSVAINANFFDQQFQPLGLVVSDGKQLHALHPVDWESIFLVSTKGEPRIVLPKAWPDASAVVAVQAGPRIVVDGEEMTVKAGPTDWRSGVCIDAAHGVILFVTPHESQFTPQDIAHVAHDELGCRDAMLFDGGPSAQMVLNGIVAVDGDKAVPTFLVAQPAPPSHYK